MGWTNTCNFTGLYQAKMTNVAKDKEEYGPNSKGYSKEQEWVPVVE